MAQTKSKKPTPRAIRNNNPLNIRRTKDKWFGQMPKQTDPFFVEFSTPTYGFRAAFRLMHTYYFKYQLQTLQAIVRRWAPPSENNTTNYIDFVAREVNVSPDLTLIAPQEPRLLDSLGISDGKDGNRISSSKLQYLCSQSLPPRLQSCKGRM